MSEQTTPSIYVASLADYNTGRLHGAWIDATQEPEAIAAEVAELLEASPTPGAEEWAIHDCQGFPRDIRLSEWESFEVTSVIAGATDTYGPDVVGAWVSDIGEDAVSPDTLGDDIAEHYRGHWASLAEFAEERAYESGMSSTAFETWPMTCIDWEQAGEELRLGGDVWTANAGDGGVLVFDTR